MAKVGLNLGLNSTVKNHKKKKGSYFRNYLIQRADSAVFLNQGLSAESTEQEYA